MAGFDPMTILNGIGDFAGGIRIGFTYFLIASPVIIGVFIFLIVSKYKHTILLRKKTKGNTDIIIEDKFRIIQGKAEVPEHIKLLKKRLVFPIPPDAAIDFKENGKYFVEGYLSEDGIITWINVDSKVSEKTVTTTQEIKLSKSVKDQIREYVLKIMGAPIPKVDPQRITTTNKYQEVTEVAISTLTTKDKSFYFNRVRLARDKYNQNNIWTFLNQHAGTIGLIIILFVIFMFWEDITRPNIEMASINAQTAGKFSEAIDKLDQLINDRQQIPPAKVLNTTTSTAQVIPNTLMT